MKIVSYNVNGLRQRITQFGSLRNLLNSFDADILCFQETKLSRQDVTADLVMVDGYESFFSCTRTSQKGRTGYSGKMFVSFHCLKQHSGNMFKCNRILTIKFNSIL